MGRRFTAVSLFGDRTYTKALKALSEQRGVDVGVLVRQSLDQVLGGELKTLIIFFAQSGQQISHKGNKKDNKEIKRDPGEEAPQPYLLDNLFSEPSALEIEITSAIPEATLLHRIQALKAELEALGCTVKITTPPDGAGVS